MEGHFKKALINCRLCPRECGVNRLEGEKGFCKAGSRAEVYSYGPHHGEEPPLSGENGSGTVFFSRCILKCIYCQNHPFSQDGEGTAYGADGLALIFRTIIDSGCNNINLVSPTPWLPMVIDALDGIDAMPVVYNTSGYERVETLERLEGFVNIYLPDLRYACEDSALEGSGVSGYVHTARAAIKEMWRQKGVLKLDGKGVAVSGLICRILVLPGREGEAIESLRWLAEELGTEVSISLMSQYTPTHKALDVDCWNRQVWRSEYARVKKVFEELGFENGWVQGFEGVDENFLGFKMKKQEINE